MTLITYEGLSGIDLQKVPIYTGKNNNVINIKDFVFVNILKLTSIPVRFGFKLNGL